MYSICKKTKVLTVPEELEYQLLTDKQALGRLVEEFAGFPLLFVDSADRLIFSAAVWKVLAEKNRKFEIIQLKINFRRGLALGWKLQKALLGVNIGQQLLFLKSVAKIFSEKELLRFGFSFTPNENLLKRLPRLLAADIFPAILNGRLALKAAMRMLDYSGFDFQPLIELFMKFRFNENEQRILVEMFSELAFKKGESISTLFVSLSPEVTKDFSSLRNDLQSKLYPAFSADLDRWKAELEKIKLPSEVRLEISPFFEKEEYQLIMKINSQEQLKAFLKEVSGFFNK